ncbi:hypothetical protein AWB77_01451 [Caballeronia fortuita]|uniref:Uncharacterized protein n=1 Tax=Caballeronia fortuita TaxID=1777138 RepID=A0A158A772_9BURK|nr:hypothetical protein [Caballeronia fortuita]SAK53638.1 hypothetical protein AWB77_01451 [Caballeronia fortuita]
MAIDFFSDSATTIHGEFVTAAASMAVINPANEGPQRVDHADVNLYARS